MSSQANPSAQEFDYTLPVARLLDIGNPQDLPVVDWPNYPDLYQLAPPDISELTRMATDGRLYALDVETSQTWAPIHAWRALGQLRAAEAVPALLTLFPRVEEEDDEWVLEELPEVMEKIGPPALPHLAAYLANPGNLVWARIPAANALERIGGRYPEARADCVSALTIALKAYRDTDPELNASLVYSLSQLKAVEAAPLVEEAFRAERVDEAVMGDWEDFQVAVGLLDERTPLDDEDLVITSPYEDRLPNPARRKATTPEEKKAKKKQKQARQMRKKNRKKK